MTASEMMVRRARETARARDGVRLKARVPAALWARVKRCAEAAGTPDDEWVCLAARAWTAGKFDGVAYDEKTLLGTREGSAAVWVRLPEAFDGRMLRRMLASAAAWHEPRIPKVTPQKGTEGWVEGRDYTVER